MKESTGKELVEQLIKIGAELKGYRVCGLTTEETKNNIRSVFEYQRKRKEEDWGF